MAAPLDLAPSLQSLPQRKERLQQALSELDNQRAALAKCSTEWKELDSHFTEIEKSLHHRHQEVLQKEQAFDAKMNDTLAALDKREQAVSTREQASLARVQEQKDAAVAAILEQKRKWMEERQRLEAALPPASEANAAKKGSSALEAKQPPPKKAAKSSLAQAVAQAMDVDSAGAKPAEDGGKADGALSGSDAKDASQKDKDSDNTPPKSVTPRPQLKSLCENMDGLGLRKFVANNRKDTNAIRAELPSALKCAIDPARTVLKALEGYHSPEQGQGDKKDAGIPSHCRACILLLEALAEVLADPVLGVDQPVVPANIRATAKEIADLWKSKLNVNEDASTGFSLHSQSFLQLVATFGLASNYDVDELCKLATSIARRKQTPALCRSLGLTAKIPDVVEKLVNDGKPAEALSLASAFELLEQFQPVPLLKAYLKDVRKTINAAMKNGNNSPAAQNEASTKELSALKIVLKCIDEYKLEAQYPSATLQVRVAQLEKAKMDKKRTAAVAKIQAKRPRANGGSSAVPPHVASVSERPVYRPAERGQYSGVSLPSYNLAAQSSFDSRVQGGYSTAYSGGSRSSLTGSYPYSADGLGSPVYGSAHYTNPSIYTSYQFGAGLAPQSSGYQSSYMH